MNIKDVHFSQEDYPEDMLEAIFLKQKQLMEKYHTIEENQGVGYGIMAGGKFNINEIKSQCLLKDFAWRVTEEITEAIECEETNSEHHFEELADALHFLTELCITAGISPGDLIYLPDGGMEDRLEALFNQARVAQFSDSRKSSPYDTVYYLGLAMNCLKQKPWKQTHILTDSKKFKYYICQAYFELCRYWVSKGKTPQDMYEFYFKKNKVNQFRQGSNY